MSNMSWCDISSGHSGVI